MIALAVISALLSIGSTLQPTNPPSVAAILTPVPSYNLDIAYVTTNKTFYGNGVTNNSGQDIVTTYANPANGIGYQLLLRATNWVYASKTYNIGFMPGTLSSNANAFESAAYAGQVRNDATLLVYQSGQYKFNPACWLNPTNFSGYCPGWSAPSFYSAELITPRNAVHSWDSGNMSGAQFIVIQTNGIAFTNGVLSDVNVIGNIGVITLSNAMPSTVVPFQILPTNFLAHITTITNVLGAYIRKNENGRIYPVQVSAYGGGIMTFTAPPANCPINNTNSSVLSSGDSGSGFFIFDKTGTPIFVMAVNILTTIRGPCPSDPGNWAAILPQLGTNQPTWASTNGLQLF